MVSVAMLRCLTIGLRGYTTLQSEIRLENFTRATFSATCIYEPSARVNLLDEVSQLRQPAVRQADVLLRIPHAQQVVQRLIHRLIAQAESTYQFNIATDDNEAQISWRLLLNTSQGDG